MLKCLFTVMVSTVLVLLVTVWDEIISSPDGVRTLPSSSMSCGGDSMTETAEVLFFGSWNLTRCLLFIYSLNNSCNYRFNIHICRDMHNGYTLILKQTFGAFVTVIDSSYGPSIGVPESAELFDETLSRRLN